MFERYTERARRVMFFSRYEASQFGSKTIESEHLLIGLLRENKNLTRRFLRNSSSVESIRSEIAARTTIRENVSTSIDLPLSLECQRILACANEEAEQLHHRHIGTEHLLLGILREENCMAARLLLERGLRLDKIREELARSTAETQGVVSHSVAVNNQWWWQLFPILEKHGFMVSRDHFSNAVNAKAAGKMEKAKAELQLVLESLVDAIREKDPQIKTLNPLFDGFDWHTSLQTLRTDLPDEEDWEFRFALTLLLIELLVKRFPRS